MATRRLDLEGIAGTTASNVPTMSIEQFAALVAESVATKTPKGRKHKAKY